MIESQKLLKILKKNKVDFFTGVPDSVLKKFIKTLDIKNHITTNNEGTAVSLAAGYYLSTKKIPCVYMQNSGLGNAINPLTSITHKKVYSIPLILVIGWRGSPDLKDEPQHKIKGKITKNLLQLLGIKFCVLKKETDLKKFDYLIKESKNKLSTIACLIPNNIIINKYDQKKLIEKNNFKISRVEFLYKLIEAVKNKTNVISSTGYNSRELDYVLKIRENKKIKKFYLVGGMGHTSAVTLGVSLKTKRDCICLDGDGSLLMHLGSSALSSKFGGKNFKYILLRNNSHESVGNQTTNSEFVNYKLLSKSLKFESYTLLHKKKKYSKL